MRISLRGRSAQANWVETGDSGLLCLEGKRLLHGSQATKCIGEQMTRSGCPFEAFHKDAVGRGNRLDLENPE